MAIYRTVDTRIWNDERFRNLTDDAQLLFFFLLTHPHSTSIGAFRTTIAGLAAEKSWTAKRCATAMRLLVECGMVQYDDKTCVVIITNYLKYNEPQSPNVVKSWPDLFDRIPEGEHKAGLLHRMQQTAERKGDSFTRAFRSAFKHTLPDGGQKSSRKASGSLSEGLEKGFRKRLPNQEQEHEQEQEREKDKERDPESLVRSIPPPMESGPTQNQSELDIWAASIAGDAEPGDAAFQAGGYSQDFEDWWLAYPVPSKKPVAWREYQGAIAYISRTGPHSPMTDAEAVEWLLRTTREFASSVAGQEPPPGSDDFRPGASAWLRDRRFEDDRKLWNKPNGRKPGRKTIDPAPTQGRKFDPVRELGAL